MTNDRTILITGVTGNQGGAVAKALQGSGFRLRGLTRKPESERAAGLARHGVDVVKGDLDDEATLCRALAGAWGVFGVQNTREAGAEREEAQGKRIWRRWRVRPASNTTSTHPWDRRTRGRASRTSTTNGASRKPCAASGSRRM
jgi:NmrA-like family